MKTISGLLDQQFASGQLTPDPAQTEAALLLDDIRQRLTMARKTRWFAKSPMVRGLYMWGAPGRGKSMLMDLLFAHTPICARRVHFHEFMGEIHDRLNTVRKKRHVARPLERVALDLANETRLLCLDELQVTQIADAMIMASLFKTVFKKGMTVIATSNRCPDNLYEHGINRNLFVPFIRTLKQKCTVYQLVSAHDYRLERLKAAPVWHVQSPTETPAALDAIFARMSLGASPERCVLTIKGRTLNITRSAAGMAWFSFDELCVQPLWTEDYCAIATRFHTVFIEAIPVLTPDKRNEAARFVALIDILYEYKVKLVASAAGTPDTLYQQGDGCFEFRRTVSRLHEMSCVEYMASEHRASRQA